MQILLDTKDLIDLIERDKPVPIAEVNRIFRAGMHELVLSYVNISELVAPLQKGMEFMDLRPLLIKVESLPVSYIRETMIPAYELSAAISAFDSDSSPAPVNPYVARWDEVITPFGESAIRPIVNVRLWEIVWMLCKQRALPDFTKEVNQLRAQFNTERNLSQKEKLSKREIFVGAVAKHLQTYRIKQPRAGLQRLGEFLYDNPVWCPSNRIAFELYHALLGNVNDVPDDGDILDINHLKTVPYVDGVTLDRA